MLKNVRIENYRAFKALEVQGLSRVNLFVGKNNSGKTSVLEALQLVSSSSPERELFNIARRRGELLNARNGPSKVEIDIRHFFYGHDLLLRELFGIYSTDSDQYQFECQVVESLEKQAEWTTTIDSDPYQNQFSLDLLKSEKLLLEITHFGVLYRFLLSSQGGISIHSRASLSHPWGEAPRSPVQVITTESASFSELEEMWDQIALTPTESQVIHALQIIEPDIERIAFLSGRNSSGEPTIVVKLQHSPERIPLGSFGDGLRRILALSIAAVRSAKGVLLVDEIDTGLHYTVMTKMWEVLIRTAQELDIQIFATTHSQDCIDGLAALVMESPELASEVTLQRVERDKEVTTAYTAEEIANASRHHIEVR